MTGYGHGSHSKGGLEVRVEVSSVNRKQLEIACNLPRDLAPFEPAVRDVVASALHRGRITLAAGITASGVPAVTIDERLAGEVAASMRRLQERLGLSGEITVETVLRAPGVIRSGEPIPDPALGEEVLLAATREALASLQRMRETEGARLKSELARGVRELRTMADEIRELVPGVAEKLFAAMQARLATRHLGIDLQDERLLRELALYADKADVSEEILRVSSHLDQFETLLDSKEPTGKALEFLAQELFRELNTTGAKCADAGITRIVVASKSEVEKIREQLANVE